MVWRRIAWFTSFAVAVALAVWMRHVEYGWSATLVAALLTWVVLPFIISQLCAAFVLARMHRRFYRYPPDEIVNKVAEAMEATKGLSPEEQAAVAKRVVDEAFKVKQ